MQSSCGTPCQRTFARYLLLVSRPISAVSISFEHSDYVLFLSSALHCFYLKLLCTVCYMAFSIGYTNAYSIVVRHCSESRRHRYRKKLQMYGSAYGVRVKVRVTMSHPQLCILPIDMGWYPLTLIYSAAPVNSCTSHCSSQPI